MSRGGFCPEGVMSGYPLDYSINQWSRYHFDKSMYAYCYVTFKTDNIVTQTYFYNVYKLVNK